MTAPKTIWYISKYVGVPTGDGAGSRGYELMRELSAMGNSCVIITSDSNHLAETPEVLGSRLVLDLDGVKVCWLRTLKFTGARSARRVLSWLHFEWNVLRLRKGDFPKPDAIIVSSLSLLTVITGLALRLRYKSRLTFEVRDIWPLTITEVGGYSPSNPFVRMLAMIERMGYRCADEVVGTMPNLAEHVANVLGAPRETRCIPMGFAPRTAGNSPDLPKGYDEEYLSHPGFIVGYAGTVGMNNALGPMFDAALTLRDDPRFHFLIVGNGELLSDYKREFASLGNITFAPRVPKVMVQSVLTACDLLYVSLHESHVYSFGQSLNKLVDYMLAGKPIVASYTGFPSMIDESGCGMFVPAGDADALVAAIRYFASMSSREREQVGEKGRTWLLEHRSYPKLATDYANILFPSGA